MILISIVIVLLLYLLLLLKHAVTVNFDYEICTWCYCWYKMHATLLKQYNVINVRFTGFRLLHVYLR